MPKAVVVAARKKRCSKVERIMDGRATVGGSLVNVKRRLEYGRTGGDLQRRRVLGQWIIWLGYLGLLKLFVYAR